MPPDQKVEARGIVKSKLAWLAEQKQRTYVRINRSPHLYDFDDILAVVGPHVEGIFISKPCGPEDVDTVSSMLSEAEYRTGAQVGSTRVIPLLETARSLQFAYEIALRERVNAIVGATAKNADVARALDTVWSAEGRETLYLKSRIVMAARAAGKLPVGGLWQQMHDLEGAAQVRRARPRARHGGRAGRCIRRTSRRSTRSTAPRPSRLRTTRE